MRTIITLGVVFAILRIALPIEPEAVTWVDVFKDLVHVYMGVLGAIAWRGEDWAWKLFWSLCVIEVFIAVLSRIGGG